MDSIYLSMLPTLTDPGATRAGHSYWLAGHLLGTGIPLPELAAFEVEAPGGDRRSPPSPDGRSQEELGGDLIYRGKGWIGNRWCEVECTRSLAGTWLAVAGVGRFWVSSDGSTLSQVEVDPTAEAAAVRETAIGPVLILALALQGTWCLHASAVLSRDCAVAFLSESEGGKSTLAAFLSGHEGGRWRLVADDILPVEQCSQRLEALAHFPQLKLPPDQQPAVGLPERMPLSTFYVLDVAATTQTKAEIEPLSRQEAVLALVRHTVAARLFDKDLLARHLSFCAEAAACVPVRSLTIPRDLTLLPRVRDLLTADVGSP